MPTDLNSIQLNYRNVQLQHTISDSIYFWTDVKYGKVMISQWILKCDHWIIKDLGMVCYHKLEHE